MRIIIVVLLLLTSICIQAQDKRIEQIRNNIEAVVADAPGLAEKVNIKIKEASLAQFLLAVSEVHKVNLNVDPSLSQISIVNNFTDVSVGDLIVFLCKEYNLSIDFTGNILSIKSYKPEVIVPKPKIINVGYIPASDLLTVDLKDDKLYDAFKRIMDESGKNIVFAPGLENKLLTAYIKDMPFEAAMNKLAYSNNLTVSRSRDGFYMVEGGEGGFTVDAGAGGVKQGKPQRAKKSNFFFNVTDVDRQLLEVDFENIPIATIVYDIGSELNIDFFLASPLDNAGTATVRAKNITFDELLFKIFEAKVDGTSTTVQPGQQPFAGNNSSTVSSSSEVYTYMKNGSVYYFGTKNQLIVRNIKSIALMHRSIELLNDPTKEGRSAGRIDGRSFSSYNGMTDGRNQQNYSQQGNRTDNNLLQASQSILTIIPDEIKKDLDIKIDKELNSFLVNGPAANIERFETFIKYIDKPVPVVLIEVMLLEVSRNATIETGISAGIGDKPTTTKGSVFPNTDMTLGAGSINKIINRFDGFGSLNIGNVVPDFYMSIKAMESNGNLKIRSSPRLSTLNGHKAYLSIGETTYYVVTNQNFYGSQIPQASEVKNYEPIDAELSVSIMPLVSGDGQITMDIKVIQSSFNGQKVDKDAPPGINSREFTSIIRVRDQDIIVLGGLEEKVKNDSGSGVPLLSRIPVIKWFFSSRKREDSRKKLTVLIKPTVMY